VKTGRFRETVLSPLNCRDLHLPPLRERLRFRSSGRAAFHPKNIADFFLSAVRARILRSSVNDLPDTYVTLPGNFGELRKVTAIAPPLCWSTPAIDSGRTICPRAPVAAPRTRWQATCRTDPRKPKRLGLIKFERPGPVFNFFENTILHPGTETGKALHQPSCPHFYNKLSERFRIKLGYEVDPAK